MSFAMKHPITPKGGFAQKVATSKPDHIFLVRAQDHTNRNAWYYVQVDRGKRDAFRARNGAASVTLTDFGTILHSGYGDHPPESIVKRMEEEHGFKTQ